MDTISEILTLSLTWSTPCETHNFIKVFPLNGSCCALVAYTKSPFGLLPPPALPPPSSRCLWNYKKSQVKSRASVGFPLPTTTAAASAAAAVAAWLTTPVADILPEQPQTNPPQNRRRERTRVPLCATETLPNWTERSVAGGSEDDARFAWLVMTCDSPAFTATAKRRCSAVDSDSRVLTLCYHALWEMYYLYI